MPTKPNRAGQQQNYVPAGNGDASGEYGDNESGSNVHFKNFKKPQDAVDETKKEEVVEENNNGVTVEEKKEEETAIPEEQPKKDLSQLLVNKLDKKSRQEVIKYFYGTKGDDYFSKERSIRTLRYYTGSFGDLSNFTDEELGQMIDEIQDLKFDKTDDWYYMKKGQKWMLTKDKEYQEFLGNKVYSKEERTALEQAKNEKNLKNQNEIDRQIQTALGGSTVVCFGKGYSKEQLDSIKDATQNLTNDFEGLKGYVTAMGDKTNLQNYLNAVAKSKQPTEEEIQAEIAKIKKYCTYYGGDVEAKYRQAAIRNLQGEVKFSSMRNAYAYWDVTHKRMIFMPRMKNSIEQLKHDYEANWHPTPDEISVYYHEMGHATEYMISSYFNEVRKKIGSLDFKKAADFNDLRANFNQAFRELRNQNYNENYKNQLNELALKKYGMRTDDMNFYKVEMTYGNVMRELQKELREKGIQKYNVSEYANTNDQEFLAECFAGHYCKANNELCEKVFNLTKKFYDDIKEFENGL